MKKSFLVLVLAVGLVGCGGGGGKDAPAAASASVAEVPRPPGGTPAPTSRSDSQGIYYSMTYGELTAWYDQHMPKGQSWRDWKWCSSTSADTPTPEPGYWRTYLRSDDTSLVVATAAEPKGGSSVLIATTSDDGGEC